MRPGVSLKETQAELDVISAQLERAFPDSNRDKGLHIDGLQSAIVEGYSQSLLILAGAIVLVLLIASGNVANLLLARGSIRGSEMAIRTALGATRFHLTRQLLVECLILALAAGCVGIVIAVWLQELIMGFVAIDYVGIGEIGLERKIDAMRWTSRWLRRPSIASRKAASGSPRLPPSASATL